MSATTYTTAPGNLWVFTLGSEKDLWVRQIDRRRHLFASETDTAALEEYDVGRDAVVLIDRIKAVLGLKGEVMMVNSGASHVLIHDRERVRLFAPEADFLKLPLTVVPALMESLRVTIGNRVYEADPLDWGWSFSEGEPDKPGDYR